MCRRSAPPLKSNGAHGLFGCSSSARVGFGLRALGSPLAAPPPKNPPPSPSAALRVTSAAVASPRAPRTRRRRLHAPYSPASRGRCGAGRGEGHDGVNTLFSEKIIIRRLDSGAWVHVNLCTCWWFIWGERWHRATARCDPREEWRGEASAKTMKRAQGAAATASRCTPRRAARRHATPSQAGREESCSSLPFRPTPPSARAGGGKGKGDQELSTGTPDGEMGEGRVGRRERV